MGLFASILEKLGLGKKDTATQKPAATTAATTTVTKPAAVAPVKPQITNMAPLQPKPDVAAISEVDVVAKLDKMAKENPQKLDWKVSIVDLLKLLGLDSSLEARKELAKELNCPAGKIGGDYSEMNMWLHKQVLARIAANGGNIPPVLYQ
jgi:hypothetical protein